MMWIQRKRQYAYPQCSMTKHIFKTSSIALLLAVACATSRFPQTKPLADGGRIRVEAAWIYDSSPSLLRVKFKYIGVKPDEYRYAPRAGLRTTPAGRDIESQYVWLVGLPKGEQSQNETPLVWEFRDFPRNSERMYLTMYFMDRNTREVKEQLEFQLPGARKLQHRDGSVP
jgi:hypothetical protein